MYKIKKATIQHIPIIRALAEKIWPVAYAEILSENQLNYMLQKFYSDKALTEQMEIKKHVFLLANGALKNSIGFGSYSYENETKFKLQKLYVDTESQGLGIGLLLLNKIVAEVKIAGAKTLTLNVNRHNKALAFYLKYGFKIITEEDIDIGYNFYMNDYVMQLDIG
jgi:ribosomal protein S18 acetylase RimI-like enzyme